MKVLNNRKGLLRLVVFASLFIAAFQACKEDLGIRPIKEGAVAGQVTNVRTFSRAGGAVIKYDLPVDKDFRYVKAVYVLNNGSRVETKSTQYKDSLIVEGYSTAGKYDVELYSVSVGEVESKPVTVMVDVSTPYNRLISENLKDDTKFVSTYGGVNIYIDNMEKQPLVIVVMKKNEENKWVNIDTAYSSLEKQTLRVRGVAEGVSTFGVFIQDKWRNNSDTIAKELAPLEEILIPKSTWQLTQIALGAIGGDWDSFNPTYGGRSLKYKTLWDGKMTVHADEAWFNSPPMPFSFSIDLGVPSILSRIKTWPRMSDLNGSYTTTHVKKFQIWGSNSPDMNDPSFDDWFLLGTFESIRPSGLPFGQAATTEDKNYVKQGEEWDFPDVNPADTRYKNRYIRVKVLSTWNGIEASDKNPSAIIMSEITLWGQR